MRAKSQSGERGTHKIPFQLIPIRPNQLWNKSLFPEARHEFSDRKIPKCTLVFRY